MIRVGPLNRHGGGAARGTVTGAGPAHTGRIPVAGSRACREEGIMLRALCLSLFLLGCVAGADARAAPARDVAVEAAMALPDDLRRMLPEDVVNRNVDDALRAQALVDFLIA